MLHLNPNRIAILFVAAIISLVTGCSRESRIARHLEKGEHYFQQREFDQAEIEYLNVLKDSESHPDALRRLGRIYYEEGKMGGAGSFLIKARNLDTNHVETRLNVATWCYSTGLLKEAREESLFVLKNDPSNEEALELLASSAEDVDAVGRQLENFRPDAAGKAGFHLAIGRLSLRSNDLPAAESAFKQALALNPKSVSAHLALASLHSKKNDIKSAEQNFKRAAELAPVGSRARLHYANFKINNGDVSGGKQLLTEITKSSPWFLPAWNRLAELSLTERNYEECAGLIRKILLRDPSNFQALLLNGRMSMNQGNTAKAISDLEGVVKLHPKEAMGYYHLARAHLLNREDAKAVSLLQQAIRLDPDDADFILILAQTQIRLGDPLSAIKRLSDYANAEKNLQKRSKLDSVYLLLADACRAQKNYDQALVVARRFAQAFPNNPDGYLLAGKALLELKRDAEARQAFNQALELSPNYFSALENLVIMNLEAGDSNAALDMLQSRLAQNPANAQLNYLLAYVYLEQKAYVLAETSFKKAIQLEPKFSAAHLQLARVYIDSKKYDRGLQTLEGLLSANPNDESALMGIGKIHEEIKNYPAARDAYDKILATNPSSPAALNNLANLYAFQFGQLDKAYEFARRAHDLLPKEPFLTDTLGWILYKRGDYDSALTLLEESSGKLFEARSDPQRRDWLAGAPEAIFHLAMVHYKTGEEQKAKDNFERALQLKKDFPSHSEATNCLAILAIDTRTDPTALKKLQDYLVQTPNDPVLLAKLGEIYESTADSANAAKTYESAIKANPKNAMVMLRLARIYASQGKDIKRALELARTAHQVLPNNAEVAALLGQLSYRSGDHALALNLLQQSAPRLPRDPQAQYYLAHAMLSFGRIKEAENAMRAALQPNIPFPEKADADRFLRLIPLSENPSAAVQATAAVDIDSILKTNSNYLPALWAGGRFREQRGSITEAQQLYERIPAQYPAFAPALKQLAVLYSTQPAGLEKAYGYAVKARQALPEDSEVSKVLGELSYQRGEFARAAQLLREAVLKLPNDAKAWYYLGRSHYSLKQPVESKKALNQALALNLAPDLAGEAKNILAELK